MSECAHGGCWIVWSEGNYCGSGSLHVVSIHATELDALREAVGEPDRYVRYVAWGENPREAMNAERTAQREHRERP